jgi:methionyl-tRNA synthetase
MVHKYFGGVVPEAGEETTAEAALRESAVNAIAVFGPAFDEMNFSEALKALWTLGGGDRRLPDRQCAVGSGLWIDRRPSTLRCKPACWQRPREAIRIITALVYPILPDSAAKVWRAAGPGRDCRRGWAIHF